MSPVKWVVPPLIGRYKHRSFKVGLLFCFYSPVLRLENSHKEDKQDDNQCKVEDYGIGEVLRVGVIRDQS